MKQGEIWWVSLDPVVGAELRKTRPCLVVSTRRYDALTVRIVVPLTSWRPQFHYHPNKVRIAATQANGLRSECAADVLHVRSVSTSRFSGQVGTLEERLLQQVQLALRDAISSPP